MTTEDHNYWNATEHEWQESQHLDPGDELHSADGTPVVVIGLDWATLHTADAFDLTVADLHTFFVAAGTDEVLVHNCGLDDLDLGLKIDAHTGSRILDGPMPNRDAVRSLNPADRAELQEMLETSISNRRADQVSGVFPSVDPRHTARIAEEESLLDFLKGMR